MPDADRYGTNVSDEADKATAYIEVVSALKIGPCRYFVPPYE